MIRNLHKKLVLVLFLSIVSLNLYAQTFVDSGISLPIVSTNPYRGLVSWGDYNNDGYLDILFAGSDFPTKIFKNNGDNTFAYQSDISFKQFKDCAAAWGDYNNDGYLDLILTGYSTEPISVIYKNNGDNTFAEQQDISLVGVYESSVAWGDYDNDGDLDILITGDSYNGWVSKIYQNNGDNTFTENPTVNLKGVFYGAAVWGDYDNDGDLDILITGGGITNIYRNENKNLFIEQLSISLPGLTFSSAAWGDYDNDGDLDFIISGLLKGQGEVSMIYKNNGDNTFIEQANINLPGVTFGAVAWGDYNNDGYLDILLSGSVQRVTRIFCNNRDNSFSEILQEELENVVQSSVAWGDYDNDKDLDILISGYKDNSTGSITKLYRNEIQTQNTNPSVPTGLISHWDNDNIVFQWSKSIDNNTPNPALNYILRIGTSSGGNQIKASQTLSNGFLLMPYPANIISDTVYKIKLPVGKYYWSVQSVDKSSLASDFASELIIQADSIQAKDLVGFIKTNNSLLIRWKNGNGSRRILFGRLSNPSGSAKLVNGTIYQAEPYFGEGSQITGTEWYCLYNGRSDSITIYGLGIGKSYELQVFEYIEVNCSPQYFCTSGNANPGIFSSSLLSEQTDIVLSPDEQYSSKVWGDFDNDGYLDILTTNIDKTRIFRNSGNNSFIEQINISLPGSRFSTAKCGDLDNDGDLDIILVLESSYFDILQGKVIHTGYSKVFRNDSFVFNEVDASLIGVYQGSLDLGDYDNDEYLDILLTGVANDESIITKLYHNNKDCTFTEQTGLSLTGVFQSSSVWGDCDNDGDLDILVSGSIDNNYNTISTVYLNVGDNSFSELPNINLPGLRLASIIWFDYDNDGDLDILLTGISEFSKIFCNQGNNVFTELSSVLLPSVTGSSVDAGDYDNDGFLDLILTGYTSGLQTASKVLCYKGNNRFYEQTNLDLAGSPYTSIGWADYDNDGDMDVLISSRIYRNNIFMKAGSYLPNKKPESPEKLISEGEPNRVKLFWSSVRSDETSYRAMTYNVRIGSSQTRVDICSPNSRLIDGYSKTISKGNAELDTSFYINNLIPGKYYWSVQSVDQGYMGGEWSAIDSFVVKNLQPFFSSDEVCLGFPTRFTDQSVSTDGISLWYWDFNDGKTSSDQNPSHIYSSSGTFNVKLIITDINGLKDSLVQAVIVKPKPLADFSAPAVCQGTAATITNTTNKNGLTISSWYWDFGDGQTSLIEQPPAHGYLGAAEYTVQLKALANNGCMDTISKKVTVGAYPVAAVTANAPLSFCKGDSVTLSVPHNADYTYTWKMDNAALTGGISNKYVAKITGNYTVDVVNTKASCFTTSSAVAIVSQNAPVAPLISSSGGDLTFCQGDSSVLNVTNTTGCTYQWKLNGGAVGSNSNQFIAKNSGTYTLIVTNSAGCSVSSTNSVVVTVNPLPVVGALALEGRKKFCSGESAILSIPATTGYTYTWKNSDGIIGGVSANSYAVKASGTYTLEVSTSAGCKVSTDPVTLEVVQQPVKPTIDYAGYTKGMCPGENPIKLSIDEVVSDYTYRWYKNGTPLSSKTFIEITDGAKYQLEAVKDICASLRDSVSIEFKETLPRPEIIAKGTAVWYLSTASQANYYKWYFNSNIIPGAGNSVYIAGQVLGIYRLAISDDGNCYSFSDTIRIPVGITGIEDTDPFEDVKIYPNPSTGMFTIEMNNNVFGELMIDIFTQNGSKVLNIKFEKTTEHFSSQIDLSGQSKGMYLINLEMQNYRSTRKIVVE
jgi:PKD repeat protein/predicted nucleotidyltransferase